MKKEQVIEKLRSCGLVAVVRAKNAEDAFRIGEACVKGGCAGMPAATSSSARAPLWIPRRPGWPSSRARSMS